VAGQYPPSWRLRKADPLRRTLRTLASDVTLGPGAGRVQGGEAGVRYQPPETRFWLRLAYRVDDALVGVMARSETVEAVLVSVGVGLP